MRVLYIAGKYSDKDDTKQLANIRHAGQAAIAMWRKGYAVICPHLNTALFDWTYPEVERNVWIDGDLEILRRCDVVYFLKGYEESEGAMLEFKLANDLGLEILFE